MNGPFGKIAPPGLAGEADGWSHPMPSSKEDIRRAEECYRLANEAKTESDRLACLDLARTWLDVSSSEDVTVPTQMTEPGEPELTRNSRFQEPERPSGWRRWVLGLFR
jgi:hypothetical protein